MKEFLKKNWLVILVGSLSAFLGVLTLLTVVRLRKTTPVAPTAPESRPEAVTTKACTLTFKLSLALTPTPTEEISPTPTTKANEPPICSGLSASPSSGEAPLKVNFTGNGTDRDGKVTAFEFSFGDGEVKIVEKDSGGIASHSLDYAYSSAGIYWASLRIRDDNNAWSEASEDCKVKIKVAEMGVGLGGQEATGGGTPVVPTLTLTPTVTIPVPKLPESGLALPTILTIFSGSLLVLLSILL